MSSPFAGISIASSALRSFQTAMAVTGNNLANVNTEGYSRQIVNFEDSVSNPYFDQGLHGLGQGVNIASITRIRDTYLEDTRNKNASDQGKSGVLSGGLQAIDHIFGEPGSGGIASSLDGLFNSFSALAADPSSGAKLASARAAGQNLADNIRSKFASLGTVANQANQDVVQTVTDINNLGKKIADLNVKIGQHVGTTSNDLLDQRDKAVNQLAQLVDIKVTRVNNNVINVSAGSYALVDGGASTPLPPGYSAATSSITAGPNSYPVRGGKLAGQFALLNSIQTQKAQLDTLANNLRTQVNAVHQAGKNSLGQSGVQFFGDVTSGAQSGAIDFDLSTAVKADYNAIATGTSGKPGDGGISQNIADLRSSTVFNLGGKNFADYFQANITAMANDASYQNGQDATNAALGTQINNQVQSNSGVSVDEEMTNMVKLQRSYSASAKMITVYDQMLQTTIEMVR